MKIWTYRVVDGRTVHQRRTVFIVTTPEGQDLTGFLPTAESARTFCYYKNKALALT